MYCIVIYKRLHATGPVIGACRSHFSFNWLVGGHAFADCRALSLHMTKGPHGRSGRSSGHRHGSGFDRQRHSLRGVASTFRAAIRLRKVIEGEWMLAFRLRSWVKRAGSEARRERSERLWWARQ